MTKSIAKKAKKRPVVKRLTSSLSRDKIDVIGSELKLTSDQKAELDRTIGTIVGLADCTYYLERTFGPYSQFSKRFISIDRKLARLQDEVVRSGKLLDHFLSLELGNSLGAILNLRTLSACGGEEGLHDARAIAVKIRRRDHHLTMEAMEAEFSERRRFLAIEYPDAAFLTVLAALRMPLTKRVEANKHNKGGTPTDWQQDLVVEFLARNSMAIIDEPATAEKSGRFVSLCWSVLHEFKFPRMDSLKPIERVLGNVKAQAERSGLRKTGKRRR